MYHIFYDLETTGLSVLEDAPIQIGAIVTDKNGQQVATWNSYIKQDKPLPDVIVKLTGITDETLQQRGVAPEVATERWRSLVWAAQPCCLIGYNSTNFDYLLLSNWVTRVEKASPFEKRRMFPLPPVTAMLDVQRIVSVALRSSKWVTLAEAARRFEVPYNDADLHGAYADAQLTRALYHKLKQTVGAQVQL